MLPLHFLNGQQCNNESIVDSRDRGLAYGDGVFETMKSVKGVVPLWSEHKARLLKGVNHLGIIFSEKQLEQDCSIVFQRLKAIDGDCVVKIIVTRGVSSRGYTPVDSPANCIAMINALPQSDLSEKGCAIHLCKEVLAEPVSWAGLKTLNQLSYVLASAERVGSVFDEGLVCSHQGFIIEATSRNLFCIRDNILLTPDLTRSGVAGVMREKIISTLAPALKIDVKICQLTVSDLQTADEVFLCNSVTGLWPVTHFTGAEGDYYWSIGGGTRQLQKAVKDFFYNFE